MSTPYPALVKHGLDLLHDPRLNKGTAFSEQERDELGLRGLLPPRRFTLLQQVERALANLRRKTSNLEKYVFLTSLQERNETVFYRLVVDHIEEVMPIIYTPTVGEACQEYAHIFRRPMGMYISRRDRGRMLDVLRNWPQVDVRVIVVTDGERILGLGDLGADGMGIPVGKLSLYVACAGMYPGLGLPIMLDVGTNNEALLNDPLYIGLPERRLRGPEYDTLIEEFIGAVQALWPKAMIQLEDFGNTNAFHLLEKYRDRICLFDDDIQGTASVTLAGLHSALRITGGSLCDQRILFLGAGEAGIGIGNLIAADLTAEGISEGNARRVCWFVDSKGLVVRSRTDLARYKLPFAHEHQPVADLLTAIETLHPTALIGVAGVGPVFSQPVVEAMTRINQRPIIFALSNPTSKSECTAEQAYRWSNGQAIFASGSPFPQVTINGRTLVPGQGNNAYIFPGVGLGVVASEASRVTNEMFATAAKTLAAMTLDSELAATCIYPSFKRIREVSVAIAVAVAELAYAQGVAGHKRPLDISAHVHAQVYEPTYISSHHDAYADVASSHA